MSKLCLSFLPKIVKLSKKKGRMIDKCDVKVDKSPKFNSQDESNTYYLSYQTAVIFFLKVSKF